MIDLHVVEVWSESKAEWVPTGNIGTQRECRTFIRKLSELLPRKRRIARYVRTAAVE